MSIIIEHVRELIREGYVSQSALAQHLGVLPQRIHYIMTCQVPKSFEHIEALLEILDPSSLDAFRPGFDRSAKDKLNSRVITTIQLLAGEINTMFNDATNPTPVDSVRRAEILQRMGATKPRGNAQESYEARHGITTPPVAPQS